MRTLEVDRLVGCEGDDAHGGRGEPLVLTLHGEPVVALVRGAEQGEDSDLRALLQRGEGRQEVLVVRLRCPHDTVATPSPGPGGSEDAAAADTKPGDAHPEDGESLFVYVGQGHRPTPPDIDEETAQLCASPKFRAIIERSRARYKAEGGISSEELCKRLGT